MMDAQGIAELLKERFPNPHPESLHNATRQLAEMIGRGSVRRFRPDKVGRDLVHLLLAAALSAPSKSDYQQATLILIESSELRGKLNQIIVGNPWLSDVPHLIVFCADTHRLRAISLTGSGASANNDLEALFNATVDAALVMQAFITAAESVGLGCCPLSAIRNHLEEIAPLLALPPGVLPVAGLAFGFPAERTRVSMRLPQRLTVQVDRYSDSPIGDEIDDYDIRRQATFASTGDPPAAKWSASKIAQLNASDSRSFRAYVKLSGFEL